jgi:DNA polymerase III sliding clamp (beta) subunit (PCNA family)
MSEVTTIASNEFVRVVNNATLFAAKPKDGRPLLQCSEVTFLDEKTVRFVTTDSYDLIVETVEAEVSLAMVGHVRLVNLFNLKPLVVAAKSSPQGRTFARIAITTTIDNLSVELKDFATGATFTQKVEGTYPDWRKLFDDSKFNGIASSDGTPLGLTLSRLGRLSKVRLYDRADDTVAARLEMHDVAKPYRMTIGQRITVYSMPVRLS